MAALLVTALGAVVFLYSGTAKAGSPDALTLTLRQLGLPERIAGPAAIAVPIAEIALSVLVLLAPGPVVATAVATTALGFAAAGWRATRSTLTITCACFGAGEHELGARQLWALPAWAAVVLAVAVGDWEAQRGLAAGAIVVAVVGAAWTSRIAVLASESAATRSAISEQRPNDVAPAGAA